jgi:Flp pilus assembly protein TadG
MQKTQRLSTERGATLLETAIVLPMLITLALGMAEIGFLVIDHMAVSNAAREGARVGAAAGQYIDGANTADTLILRSVEQAACQVESGAVTFVTIYRANGVNGQVPANAVLKNIYAAPSDGILNCSPTGPTTFTCTNSCAWTPDLRDNTLPGLDDLGVFIQFRHDPIVGIFPFTGPMNVSDKAVMRIEPNTRG